ncbi:MAG: hypothetical protein QM770_10365 [Tepidisphaeraceae bacterium]
MKRALAIAVSVGLTVLSTCVSNALAWSSKEHIQLTRIAIERLLNDPTTPASMKEWLRATPTLGSMDAEKQYLLDTPVGRAPDPKALNLAGLTWWCVVPDIEAERKDGPKIPPFDQHERFNHYLDMEVFSPADKPKDYRDDLSAKAGFNDIPRDFHDPRYLQAGYLPLATEHCYQELVRSIRARKLHADPVKEGDTDHADRWAGYLAHYIEDNTQPLHATIDYKSKSYFPHDRTPPNVHAEMEYKLVDESALPLRSLRTDYWTAFTTSLELGQDPILATDIFELSVRTSIMSYDALPLIGHAAVASNHAPITAPSTAPSTPLTFDTESFYRFRGKMRDVELSVYEMKAIQQAIAVKHVERVLRQAWDEASK